MKFLRPWLQNVVILTPKKVVALIAPLFNLEVDFDFFIQKYRLLEIEFSFLGQSSH
jgi:hypothetical protein